MRYVVIAFCVFAVACAAASATATDATDSSACAQGRDGVVGGDVAASGASCRDPEDSLTILRFLANQLRSSHGCLKRYDRKPKHLASRKLYVLQGLPGVGPALAHRLLLEFGSVERVMTADEEELMRVRGVGRQKAARIRNLVG
jgi:hypothetical protein